MSYVDYEEEEIDETQHVERNEEEEIDDIDIQSNSDSDVSCDSNDSDTEKKPNYAGADVAPKSGRGGATRFAEIANLKSFPAFGRKQRETNLVRTQEGSVFFDPPIRAEFASRNCTIQTRNKDTMDTFTAFINSRRM